jgi:uncharacterized protein
LGGDMGKVQRGRFVWYELMTKDPGSAKAFYQDVIGWNAMGMEVAGEDYTMFANGEVPHAGMMQLPEEADAACAPSHWIGYIGVPDVEQAMADASEMGARTFIGPMSIPDVGKLAVMADPQGAAFAVYNPESDLEDAGPPQSGQVSWHELITTDHEAAFDFYARLAGWEKTSSFDMGEAGLYQMYGVDGLELGGMYNTAPDMSAPPHWLLYIKVDDIEGASERVKAGGGQVLNGPEEVPGGDRVAHCMDPTGAAFALHAVAAG